jgi:hypothetical protein
MTDPHTIYFCVNHALLWAFRGFEAVGAFLVGYVLCQTERDPACKKASWLLHEARRVGLLATSSSLMYCAVCFSIEAMMAVIFFGALNFVFNSVALKERENPPNSSTPVHVLGGRRFAFRPSAFEAIRRDHHHDAAE